MASATTGWPLRLDQNLVHQAGKRRRNAGGRGRPRRKSVGTPGPLCLPHRRRQAERGIPRTALQARAALSPRHWDSRQIRFCEARRASPPTAAPRGNSRIPALPKCRYRSGSKRSGSRANRGWRRWDGAATGHGTGWSPQLSRPLPRRSDTSGRDRRSPPLPNCFATVARRDGWPVPRRDHPGLRAAPGGTWQPSGASANDASTSDGPLTRTR